MGKIKSVEQTDDDSSLLCALGYGMPSTGKRENFLGGPKKGAGWTYH